MDENQLVDELAAKARVGAPQARAVLVALAQLARDTERSGQSLPLHAFGLPDWSGWRRSSPPASLEVHPTPTQVDELIEDARRHPFGIDFLLRGELGCVAMTFGVHAFAVDAARQRLADARG